MERVLEDMVEHSNNQEIMDSADVMLEIVEEIILLSQDSGVGQYERILKVFNLLELYFLKSSNSCFQIEVSLQE